MSVNKSLRALMGFVVVVGGVQAPTWARLEGASSQLAVAAGGLAPR